MQKWHGGGEFKRVIKVPIATSTMKYAGRIYWIKTQSTLLQIRRLMASIHQHEVDSFEKKPKRHWRWLQVLRQVFKRETEIMPPSILAVYIYDIQARVHCRLLKSSTSIFNAWRGVVKCTKGRKNKKYFFCTGHLQSSRTFFPECTGYEWRSGKGSQ